MRKFVVSDHVFGVYEGKRWSSQREFAWSEVRKLLV
jgi:hypothetical protein